MRARDFCTRHKHSQRIGDCQKTGVSLVGEAVKPTPVSVLADAVSPVIAWMPGPVRPCPAGVAAFQAEPFADIQKEVLELLDMDNGKPGGGLPVEVTKDTYGYTWLVVNHMSDEMDALVTDLHAVNSALIDGGFGPQLLCTLVAFKDDSQRRYDGSSVDRTLALPMYSQRRARGRSCEYARAAWQTRHAMFMPGIWGLTPG